METTRTFDILTQYHKNFKKDIALAGVKNGEWYHMSTNVYFETAHFVSYALLALGLEKGDRIATVSNNRPEWNCLDMGIAMAGMVHVPIYPTISDRSFKYVLEHSEAKLFVIGTSTIFDNVKNIINEVPTLKYIYTIDKIENQKDWNEFIELGKNNQGKYKDQVEEIKQNIDKNEMVTIIYTSGTTGVPKGVMLSHHNFVSNVKASVARFNLTDKHKVLSFLPLNHVYERMVNYQYQYKGLSIYYAESMDTIGDNLKEIKPHGFATVPRLLEKVYDKIVTKGKSLSLIKRSLLHWAINLGVRYEPDNRNGIFYSLQLVIANKLIFSKWREALGGNIEFLCSGGAALQERLERVFWAAGIRIQEGYGLTETSPIISANMDHWPNVRFGTVGTLLDQVEVKIAEDGEILTKGPNLMLGYYKDPELTAKAIDEEGWFHTGDIGKMVEDKFLKIIDRKKEIFKTSGGVYIAPQVIENYLKESIFIDQAWVVGEGKRFPAVIISPNFTFLQDYCKQKNINCSTPESMIEDETVKCRIGVEVNKINERLDKHKKIKEYRLIADSWTPDSGELSPTLKLKRHILKERYKAVYDDIYKKDLDEFL